MQHNVVILRVVFAVCRKLARYADCHYAECLQAECRDAIVWGLGGTIISFLMGQTFFHSTNDSNHNLNGELTRLWTLSKAKSDYHRQTL
jgi:hypothetical protein